MGIAGRIAVAPAMASRWRQRRVCVLIAGETLPACLRAISATSASLVTDARPALGRVVELQHPEAGTIAGTVRAIADDGITLAFACSEHSVAFALAAISADMSQPLL